MHLRARIAKYLPSSLSSLLLSQPKQQVRPTTPIQNLPLDILWTILDHLEDWEKVAFGLTCWDFHRMANKDPMSITSTGQRFLLQAIHRDCPQFHYCEDCIILHPFSCHIGPFKGINEKEVRRGFACDDADKIFGPGGGSGYNRAYSLSFCHAKLVMDRHRVSPRHGLPLGTLSGKTSSITHLIPGYEISQLWRSRIIEDQLFLSATHTFRHSGNTIQLRHAIDNTHFSICGHLDTNSSCEFISKRIPELKRCKCAEDCSHTFAECKDVLGSCPYCPTDYEISVTRNTSRRTEITIVTYHQIGPCRTRHEWKWKAFTTEIHQWPRNETPPLNRTTIGFQDGDIKRAWISGRVQIYGEQDASYGKGKEVETL